MVLPSSSAASGWGGSFPRGWIQGALGKKNTKKKIIGLFQAKLLEQDQREQGPAQGSEKPRLNSRTSLRLEDELEVGCSGIHTSEIPGFKAEPAVLVRIMRREQRYNSFSRSADSLEPRPGQTQSPQRSPRRPKHKHSTPFHVFIPHPHISQRDRVPAGPQRE